jgi:ABC-2 type transport system ATP-binding protein
VAVSTRAVISVAGIRKTYGRTVAVDEVSFEVRDGEIFGLIGPNGAGKTTTIRLLLDLIRPTSGSAQILGLDCHSESIAIRHRVGYLPGELELYEEMTSTHFFKHFADLRGLEDLTYAHELSDRLGLDVRKKIGDLSKGNKQKAGLVQAFMHRPDLLILDEPTSGLDPLVQHEFHTILAETVGEGRTVFLSSHVLFEIEHMAHRIAILREGQLVVVEDVATLKAKAARRIEFHFGGPIDPSAFQRLDGVRDAAFADNSATFTIEGSLDPLIKAAARFEVIDVISEEPDLEEVFLEYYAAKKTDA